MQPVIRVIGSGEAFDAGLGNTSYLFSGGQYPSVLFDCGYQIPERLWSTGLHTDLSAICFTHLHADHSFGIVPLIARYWEEQRSTALHIFGPRGTETYVKKLFELGYPGFMKRLKFPVTFHELSPSKPTVWKKLKLTTARTIHSVLNLTIRVDLMVDSKVQLNQSFAISGDGQLTENTRALVEDVNLLLQEVYTLRPEVPVHADLVTVSAFVEHSHLKRIGVAHQARNGKSKVHAHIHKLFKKDARWLVLKPGMKLPLKIAAMRTS